MYACAFAYTVKKKYETRTCIQILHDIIILGAEKRNNNKKKTTNYIERNRTGANSDADGRPVIKIRLNCKTKKKSKKSENRLYKKKKKNTPPNGIPCRTSRRSACGTQGEKHRDRKTIPSGTVSEGLQVVGFFFL